MRSVTLRDARADIEAVLDAAQKERILITREGKRSAVVVGVESYDEEDWELANSAEFWQMIEDRRRNPGRGIPIEEVKVRLKEREKRERAKDARSSGAKTRKPKALRK